MNVIGAFSFGRFIKTFVPGFVLLASVLLACDGYMLRAKEAGMPAWLDKHEGAVLWASAVVLCVILGLLSNTLVFSGVSDFLVRRPVMRNRKNKATFDAKREIDRLIRAYFSSKLQALGSAFPKAEGAEAVSAEIIPDDILDSEYVALRTIEVVNLVHVQEQYWYFMELHINLALSLTVFLGAATLRLWLVEPNYQAYVFWHVVPSLVVIFFMVSMARKNYLRHVKKMCSLLISFVAGIADPVPTRI